METIKSSSEISRLFQTGKRVSNRYITFIINKNNIQHDRNGRVAFIAGKKNGNAVWRNRAKRRMRSLYNELKKDCACYDIIFIAKNTVNNASYRSVLESCKRTLKNLSLREGKE